jgi:hypothetical protein
VQEKSLAFMPSSAWSSSNDTHSTKVGPVTTDHTTVGIKPVSSSKPPAQTKSESVGVVGRRALPGLVSVGQEGMRPHTFVSHQPESHSPSHTSTLPLDGKSESHEFPARHLPGLTTPISPPTHPIQHDEKSPSMPARHARIPSTGKRATVMHVARVMSDQQCQSSSIEPIPPPSEPELTLDTVNTRESFSPVVIRPKMALTTQAEKRKSSYDKYSAIILPPLKEETTPASSPASSLLRSTGQIRIEEPGELDTHAIHKSLEEVPGNDRSWKTSAALDVVHLGACFTFCS